MKYKNWTIQYDPKPIPMRQFDYDCWHDDYSGDENDNDRFFSAGSIEEAKLEIDERNDEN